MSEQTENSKRQRSGIFRLFAYCVNKLWLLLATLIILIAVLHILLGLLLPKIDRYNQEITDWVKQNYGLVIEMSELSAEWSIEGPSLSLSDFKLKSADGAYNLLNVKKVSVEVDLLTSMVDGRISTQNIKIAGADIQFYISSNFGVALANQNLISNNQNQASGQPSIGLESVSQELFDMLFGQRRITLVDSNMSLFTLAGTEFKYLIEELEVVKFDQIHQLFGHFSYTGGGEVTLVSEVYGDPTTSESYSNVYLQGSEIELSQLPWINLEQEFVPKFGELGWQFWGTWKERHWQDAKAIIELKNATMGEQSQQNNRLESMITWSHKDIEKGYLSIHNTSFQVGDNTLASAETLGYFERIDEQNIDWNFYLANLQTTPISLYLQSVLGDSKSLVQFLKNTEISTEIDQLSLSIEKRRSIWQPLNLNVAFSGLAMKAWDGLPGLNQINGQIQYANQSGQVAVFAEDTSIAIADLFRHSIQAKNLQASANWNIDNDGLLSVNVQQFSMLNNDFQLVASGAFQYMDEQPIVNMYAELHDANAANKSLYLPVGVMTDELVSYLDSSIKSGHLPIAKSIIRGPINNFPFDSLDGTFIAYGEVKDAEYLYLPDWPLASQLDAVLLFDGSKMDIVADAGESMNNRVGYARAYAKDLSADNAILELTLRATSQDNSGHKFLEQTPLDFIYEAISEVEFKGRLNSQIKLDINLDDPEQLVLDGKINFNKERAEISTDIVDVSHISGQLKFDQTGILPSTLSAEYFGNTMELSVQSGQNDNEPVLSIDAKGAIPVAGITHFIGERWQPFFEGESDYTALIQFAPADDADSTRVLFQTDMKGMTLNFPGEFGKSAEQVLETYLTLNIGEVSVGEIQWGDASGRWFWQEDKSKVKTAQSNNKTKSYTPQNESLITDQVQSEQDNALSPERQQAVQAKTEVVTPLIYGGDFYLGKQKDASKLLSAKEDGANAFIPGLRVKGELASANLNQWLEFIAQLDNESDSAGSEDFELIFEDIAITVGSLDAGVTQVKELNLQIKKLVSQPWQVAVNNSQIDASMILNEYSPWTADIKFADLEIANQSSEADSSANTFSPLSLNNIDLRCMQCKFNRIDYGELLAEVRQIPRGVSILGKMSKGDEHQISVSGLWFETIDDQQETQLMVELNSDNIGRFLKQWELDATVEDSSGRVIAKAWWDGAPWQMDYTRLDGDFQLALGKGYLSEISDEQGRLFSLFNLQSILRKLTFDFKDVYKKGFFYDTINGTIRIREGIVSTENVEIEGNVADVKLFGETNLKEQTIDQTAVITPHLTSSFPVLAAWAVEPTTGLLVFLLDKIMEPAVEVATRLDYRISGTFEQVEVEEMKRAKKKIKVEYASELEQSKENEQNQGSDQSEGVEQSQNSNQEQGLNNQSKSEEANQSKQIESTIEEASKEQTSSNLEPDPNTEKLKGSANKEQPIETEPSSSESSVPDPEPISSVLLASSDGVSHFRSGIRSFQLVA